MEKRYIVAKRRSEQGKLIRRQYKNDIGVPYQLCKGYSLMLDGYSNTITTFTTDNWILELKDNDNMDNLVYHPHPTKEQLLEYFSQSIRVRKMTPREAFRLMDVDDADIDKIMNAKETVVLKNGTTKTHKAISKTACYKLAGNSIVVACLYHIFRTMFIPNQPENQITKPIQQSLFDIL
jgi:site-specific DNA-cytosine methylase